MAKRTIVASSTPKGISAPTTPSITTTTSNSFKAMQRQLQSDLSPKYLTLGSASSSNNNQNAPVSRFGRVQKFKETVDFLPTDLVCSVRKLLSTPTRPVKKTPMTPKKSLDKIVNIKKHVHSSPRLSTSLPDMRNDYLLYNPNLYRSPTAVTTCSSGPPSMSPIEKLLAKNRNAIKLALSSSTPPSSGAEESIKSLRRRLIRTNHPSPPVAVSDDKQLKRNDADDADADKAVETTMTEIVLNEPPLIEPDIVEAKSIENDAPDVDEPIHVQDSIQPPERVEIGSDEPAVLAQSEIGGEEPKEIVSIESDAQLEIDREEPKEIVSIDSNVIEPILIRSEMADDEPTEMVRIELEANVIEPILIRTEMVEEKPNEIVSLETVHVDDLIQPPEMVLFDPDLMRLKMMEEKSKLIVTIEPILVHQSQVANEKPNEIVSIVPDVAADEDKEVQEPQLTNIDDENDVEMAVLTADDIESPEYEPIGAFSPNPTLIPMSSDEPTQSSDPIEMIDDLELVHSQCSEIDLNSSVIHVPEPPVVIVDLNDESFDDAVAPTPTPPLFVDTEFDVAETIEISDDSLTENKSQHATYATELAHEIVVEKCPSVSSVDSAKGSSIVDSVASHHQLHEIGQLGWARVGSYPFWPCLYCPDDENQFIEHKKRKCNEFSILFLLIFISYRIVAGSCAIFCGQWSQQLGRGFEHVSVQRY